LGKQTLATADAIGKTADRAGISTKMLQEMHHALELTGVGTDATNQAMLVFGKRLGKARDGVGALMGGLKKGHPELLKNLEATKNNGEALEVIFEAMANATNEAERLAIADAAFGGTGLKMTAAFKDGAESFKNAREEANELGKVLTEKGVRSAEAFNDMVTRLSGSITGQLGQSFLNLLPLINENEEKIISIAKSIGESLVTAIRVAVPILKGIGKGFIFVGTILAKFAIGVDKFISFILKIPEIFSVMKKKIIDSARKLFIGVNTWVLNKLSSVFDSISAKLGLFTGFFSNSFARMKDHAIETAKRLYMGVKTWLLDKLSSVIRAVGAKVAQVTGFFGSMFKSVVGNSFVPDMVDGIQSSFGRLENSMVKPAGKAVKSVEGVFKGMQANVGELIGQFLNADSLNNLASVNGAPFSNSSAFIRNNTQSERQREPSGITITFGDISMQNGNPADFVRKVIPMIREGLNDLIDREN